MIYEAIALKDDLPGGRIAVSIEVIGNQLQFQIQDQEFVWNVSQVEIEQGGSGNQLIYVKSKQDPSITLYTRDKKLLKNPDITKHRNLGESSKQIRGSFRNARIGILTLVFIIVAIPAVFFFFRSFFIRKLADKVPVQWEVEAGDKLFTTLQLQYKIIQDSAVSAKFDSLFAPLVQSANYDSIQFKFYLCEDASLNAFALPGGHVVINSGTIEKIDRIEELYGVIGHELAHVTERHHLRGLIGNLGGFLILQGIFGSEAGIAGSIGESAGHLSSLFYSRKFETESDIKGYEYLKKANISPHGMIEFFERIEREQEEMLGEKGTEALESLNSFISTHPGTKERIDYLEKQLEKDNINYNEVDYDVQQLKDFIHSKLKD